MLALRSFLRFSRPAVLSKNISSWQLAYKENGEPMDVLFERTVELSKPKDHEVLVNYRASPINPSDINCIQGIYPIKLPFPAVPGNEGAGYVLECGSSVSKLKPGDLVMPTKPGAGTWRSTAIYDESELMSLNPKLSVKQAALLKVNPSTSYLMLKNIVDLKPGDCVIQNGATSTTGVYVMQICKIMGVNSINIFRARDTPEKTEKTRKSLLDFGGTLVLTEEELKERKDVQDLGKIKLALDCLGGKPALTVMKHLEPYGTLINYGGMTRQPIPVPVSALIFKGIQIRGFWLSGRESNLQSTEEKVKMFGKLSDWFIDGKLQLAPAELIPHTDWKTAVQRSLFKNETPSYLPCKSVLSFPEVA